MAKKYEVGDMIILSATWAVDGEFTDPTTVKLKIKSPEGEVTEYVYGEDEGVVKDSVGKYHFNFDILAEGTWHYKWYGVGAAHAASYGSFNVVDSPFE